MYYTDHPRILNLLALYRTTMADKLGIFGCATEVILLFDSSKNNF